MLYVGCSEVDYCGYSNDDCVPEASCILNNATYHSCGTCDCIKADPLKISPDSDSLSLTNATVGAPYENQTKITATAGIKPYTWSLLIDQQNISTLDWLAISAGGDGGNTAVLNNATGKSPSVPTDGVTFRIHVFDGSVKGQKDRLDNDGVEKEVTLKINPQ